MKTWFFEHKLYVFAAVLIVLGGFYYYFIYQDPLTARQQIIEPDKSLSSTKKADQQKEQQTKPETVMVDVKGEIKQPGVYSANSTERVIDVIQRAGGLTEKADKRQVNFAAHVQDAMIIYIPAMGEAGQNPAAANQPQAAGTSSSSNNSAANANSKININQADGNELQNLTGIGPAKANAIIQYREENGPFQTIEDLQKVSGIGDKTFEKLKDSISVQ